MRVWAYAKINLSLRVLGVRPDGYHDLRTIFQSIALHDTLTIRARRGPFALLCNDPACPSDRSNLVWRTAERVWAASGRRGALRDVEITLAKRIPLEAGLGGGSSDAAAALGTLGRLWRVDVARLREIAPSLGADVPYFLEGGTVLGLERGDLLFPLADYPASWVTLVLPGFGVNTAEAYAWWDASRVAASGGDELVNDLQGPVIAHHPEIAGIVEQLRRAGAWHAAISGSGSAVFGLFQRRPAAERAARALSKSLGAMSGPGGRGLRSIFPGGKGPRIIFPGGRGPRIILVTRTVNRATYQRLAGIPAHRINFPIASRRPGHS